jgi:hypothetical protein
MMDKSEILWLDCRSCRYLTSCRGVVDSSIIQGPFPVAPCQTLISRFATFSSLQEGGAPLPGRLSFRKQMMVRVWITRDPHRTVMQELRIGSGGRSDSLTRPFRDPRRFTPSTRWIV